MQCGQIERIWFEDDWFSFHSYLSPLEDNTSPPAQKTYSQRWDESPPQTKVSDRASAASLPSWIAVNETPATH